MKKSGKPKNIQQKKEGEKPAKAKKYSHRSKQFNKTTKKGGVHTCLNKLLFQDGYHYLEVF